MTKYEIVCILHQKSDIELLKNKIKGIITNNNCSIIEENDWGIRDFAYEIKKQNQGFYFIMIANTIPENINELLRITKISKDIIRILIINTEKEKNYIQTVKLSSTEIKNDRIEHKTIGKKYKKRTFDIKIDNDEIGTENVNSVQADQTTNDINSENKIDNLKSEDNQKSTKIVDNNDSDKKVDNNKLDEVKIIDQKQEIKESK